MGFDVIRINPIGRYDCTTAYRETPKKQFEQLKQDFSKWDRDKFNTWFTNKTGFIFEDLLIRGAPDFLIVYREKPDVFTDYYFVELKTPNSGLAVHQLVWFCKFKQPMYIGIVDPRCYTIDIKEKEITQQHLNVENTNSDPYERYEVTDWTHRTFYDDDIFERLVQIYKAPCESCYHRESNIQNEIDNIRDESEPTSTKFDIIHDIACELVYFQHLDKIVLIEDGIDKGIYFHDYGRGGNGGFRTRTFCIKSESSRPPELPLHYNRFFESKYVGESI